VYRFINQLSFNIFGSYVLLGTLEGKVSRSNNYQYLQDLQNSITWPPVYELDTKTVLPEVENIEITLYTKWLVLFYLVSNFCLLRVTSSLKNETEDRTS